jgi:uncharacterized membrane protein
MSTLSDLPQQELITGRLTDVGIDLTPIQRVREESTPGASPLLVPAGRGSP